MKKKSLFKSKTQMILYSIVFIICIALFIIIGKTDFQKDIDTEGKKFHSLYDMVPNDNLYMFCDATDVLNIINGQDGVVLMGFPSNKWMNNYANILNEVGKDLQIDSICYYDFLQDRKESNGTYETIVNKLKVYVKTNDEGIQDLQSPTVIVVKNREVIGYFDDTSIINGTVTPEIYYTENQKALTYEQFKTALLEYIK